MKNLDSYN